MASHIILSPAQLLALLDGLEPSETGTVDELVSAARAQSRVFEKGRKTSPDAGTASAQGSSYATRPLLVEGPAQSTP